MREHDRASDPPSAEAARSVAVDEAPGAYDADGACRFLGQIGRTSLFGLVRDGKLRPLKIGRRTVYTREALNDCLSLLEAEANR